MSDTTPTEQWRPIRECAAYEVSSRGRVRQVTGRLLAQSRSTGKPYSKVALKSSDGRRLNRLVHRLVADAFLGPRPNGTEVCHNNGDASDNRAENLRYDTHRANAADTIKHRTAPRGERGTFAKLTPAQVAEVRLRHAAGERSWTAMAPEYGVSEKTLRRVANLETWVPWPETV